MRLGAGWGPEPPGFENFGLVFKTGRVGDLIGPGRANPVPSPKRGFCTALVGRRTPVWRFRPLRDRIKQDYDRLAIRFLAGASTGLLRRPSVGHQSVPSGFDLRSNPASTCRRQASGDLAGGPSAHALGVGLGLRPRGTSRVGLRPTRSVLCLGHPNGRASVGCVSYLWWLTVDPDLLTQVWMVSEAC